MDTGTAIVGLAFSKSMALTCLAFSSALVFSLALVPLTRKVAIRFNILDRPGGRKEHVEATPLLGGVAVFLACLLALLIVTLYESVANGGPGPELRLDHIQFIFLGSIIIFLTGLVDDLFKDKLPFYYKLLGQIIGSTAAMTILFFDQIKRLVSEDVPFADYIYLLILMVWMLTVINAFNFSDNLNGLMSGLAVIALLTSMVYLGAQVNTRFIILGFIMVGAILGFLPFNFPKARIFLGDAGSMFIGYWIGVILWPLTAGFFGGGSQPFYGLDRLIPALLVLGIPLYDAAFVVVMRWREGRPVYLGDNRHLSHRLVRTGFSKTETALILWGLAFILAGVGAMSMHAGVASRYMSLLIALSFMLIVTVLVIKKEKETGVVDNSPTGKARGSPTRNADP